VSSPFDNHFNDHVERGRLDCERLEAAERRDKWPQVVSEEELHDDVEQALGDDHDPEV